MYGMYATLIASSKSCAFYEYRNLLIGDNWGKNAKLSGPLTPEITTVTCFGMSEEYIIVSFTLYV